MSATELERLAEQAGLAPLWRDTAGRVHAVSPAVLRAVLGAFGLPAASEAQCRESVSLLGEQAARRAAPLLVVAAGEDVRLDAGAGRWCVRLEAGGRHEGVVTEEGVCLGSGALAPGYYGMEARGGVQGIAITPRRAFALADASPGRRIAGLAVQLYALRRRNDGGIGDLLALTQLAERAAAHGIDALTISPIHALSLAKPEQFSPYFPSSRVALNPAYATFDGEPGWSGAPELIDWPEAIRRKVVAARRAFASAAADRDFAAFCAAAPPELLRYALFEAIAASEVGRGGSPDWRRWPPELHDPAGPAVRAFAADHPDALRFHLYLQYRVGAEFASATARARAQGMKVGVIGDLAVGVDPGGADAWGWQDEMLRGVSIGAPPDAVNREGQGWGVTSFSPLGLRRHGFRGFIATLRAAFRHGGGIRIDHAMGLRRLWIIPAGAPAPEGVYLRYPFRALLGLLALESLRHRSVVLAEDLGTVPAGFSEELADHGLAGLNVLWLERTGGGFRSPSRWRREAAAMTATHDMPTVAGWWCARDIAWRERLGLAGVTDAERARDRSLLWRALLAAGCASGPEPSPEDYRPVVDAAAGYLGLSASRLALLPLEDALGRVEQPNIPATIAEHPNWRRRLPEDVATMLDRPDVAARLALLTRDRTSR